LEALLADHYNPGHYGTLNFPEISLKTSPAKIFLSGDTTTTNQLHTPHMHTQIL